MKKNLGKVLLMTLALALAGLTSATAKEKETYRSVLQQYLEITGTTANVSTAKSQMLDLYRKLMPDMPEEVWEIFDERFDAIYTDNLLDIYEPIYKKHLTISDLKQIIKFYESPVGKKLTQATPEMLVESMEAGAELGQKLSEEIIEILSELDDEDFED